MQEQWIRIAPKMTVEELIERLEQLPPGAMVQVVAGYLKVKVTETKAPG